ncbi:MAG: carboxypeptidase regulatory-like domain-containing protein [Planctomycetes bacterium]|nr:carboxypeptidase regulatory-like domain-containing protein [Planctomycetota bacterium]
MRATSWSLFAVALLAGTSFLLFGGDRGEPADQKADTPIVSTSAPSMPGSAPIAADAPREEIREDTQAIVRGRCLDEMGHSIAGVSAVLHGWPGSDEAMAKHRLDHGEIAWTDPPAFATRADGVFEFRFDPPPPYQFFVMLTAEGRAAASRRIRGVASKAGIDLGDVRLPPGCEVRGSVTTHDGAAIAGCRFSVEPLSPAPRAEPWGWELRERIDAVSDAQGRYSSSMRVPAGRYRAVAIGHVVEAPSGPVELAPGSTEVNLVLRSAPANQTPTIRGLVVDERGEPIEGVEVSAERTGASGRSRDDGRFELRRMGFVRDDLVTVVAFADGYAAWRSGEPLAWGTDGLRITLVAGSPLTIRVRRAPDDQPVERFGVELARERQDGVRSSDDYALRHAGEHERGVLEIGKVGAGAYQLVVVPAESTGLAESEELRIEVVTSAPLVVDVRVMPPARRGIEVVDAAGRGIAGVRAELLAHEDGATVTVGSWAMEPRHARMNRNSRVVALVDAATTGASGHAELRGRAGSRFALRLPGPGHVPLVVQPFSIDEPSVARIVVASGATLRGRVEPSEVLAALRAEGGTAPGIALASADPQAAVTPGQRTGQGLMSAIDEDGRFAIVGVPAGVWHVQVTSQVPALLGMMPVQRVAIAGVRLTDGEDREIALDLRPWMPRTVTLKVRVDGAPHVGRLSLTGDCGLDPAGAPVRQLRHPTADPNGELVIALPPGTWTPSVHVAQGRSGFWLEALPFVVEDLEPAAPLTFDLRSARRAVTVHDEAGQPVEGLELHVAVEGRGLVSTLWPTDAQGRTTVFGAPGLVTLIAHRGPARAPSEPPAATSSGTRLSLVVGTVELLAGAVEPVVIRLPPEWRELPR